MSGYQVTNVEIHGDNGVAYADLAKMIEQDKTNN